MGHHIEAGDEQSAGAVYGLDLDAVAPSLENEAQDS